MQKLISFAPASHRINYLFQRYVTGGIVINERFVHDKLIHLRDHLAGYREFAGQAHPRTTLELGTGWYPVIPIGLFLAGAESIHSVDITPLVDRDRVVTTMDAILDHHRAGRLGEYFEPLPDRMDALEEMRLGAGETPLLELLRGLNIHLLVTDARRLPLADGSIDLVTSNNTLEHVTADALVDILREFARLSHPGTVMSHFIDMSDHFAHLDKSIDIYNFLRFSDAQWRLIDNSVQPQNRLRYGDYLSMYAELGLPILREFHRPGDVRALETAPLARRFRSRPREELAISHCHIYSGPPA